MSSYAEGVASVDLDDYQRALRVLVRHGVVTDVFPDARALPLVRLWAERLASDVFQAFGYRLVLSANAAKLTRVLDIVDLSQPLVSRSDRRFDRRRYAYLVLALAELDQPDAQVLLSKLATRVRGTAQDIPELGLDLLNAEHRHGLVDALNWLEDRGVLALADGSVSSWVRDPTEGDAMYDVRKDVVHAFSQLARVPQHVPTARTFLAVGQSQSRDTRRREAARGARRLLLEFPVVYYAEVPPEIEAALRHPSVAEDMHRLIGLSVERRAEGIALIDTSGRTSDVRFPGVGTVANTALLLIVTIADRLDDVDAEPPVRHVEPSLAERTAELIRSIDLAKPDAGGVLPFVDAIDADGEETTAPPESAGIPFLLASWLTEATRQIVEDYRPAIKAEYLADVPRLARDAVDRLVAMRLLARHPGGVLVLPALARYRHAVLEIRDARSLDLQAVEDNDDEY